MEPITLPSVIMSDIATKLTSDSIPIPDGRRRGIWEPWRNVVLYHPGVEIYLVGIELFTEMDGAGNYVFQVDEWRQLAQRITASEFDVASVAYTNMFLLENSTAFLELHQRLEAEYRLYSEIKRRVKDVDYKSDKVPGFEFEGKKSPVTIQTGRKRG